VAYSEIGDPRFQLRACSVSTDCTPPCCSPSSRWEARLRRFHSITPPYVPEPSWPSGWRPPHPRSSPVLVAERLRRLQPLLTAGAPLPDAGDRVDELRTLGRCSVRSLAAASVSVSLAVVLAGALRRGCPWGRRSRSARPRPPAPPTGRSPPLHCPPGCWCPIMPRLDAVGPWGLLASSTTYRSG
jgi:hypothetical protein